MKRAYSMDQWQRDFAAAFAAAVPMEALGTKARGPLLAAENDEPEPKPSRPHAEGAHQPQGASHATTHDDIEQITPGSRQHDSTKTADAPCILETKGLTQQATNNPCVTARKDGQSFAAIDASATDDARKAAAELEAAYLAGDRARNDAKATAHQREDRRALDMQMDAQARADWRAR